MERVDLMAVLEAGRWAPSWKDHEPWRFVLCDRFEHADAWQRAFDCLAPGDRPWAYGAAALVVTCADTRSLDGSFNRRALYDTGGAALQLCLEATARNLATHSTSDFDSARLRAAFDIPARFECAAVIAVGHRADTGTLGRDLYRREIAAVRREPIGSRFFDGQWERPVSSERSARERR